MIPGGRLALVVGGTRGIGLATAEALREQGRRVVVTSRTDAASHDGFARIPCDVRGSDSVRDALSDLERRYGHPAIVVVNAGTRRDRLLPLMTDEDFRTVLDTNLTGAWRVASAVLPCMADRGWGRLVFVSSVAAVTGERGQTNYAASKSALIGMTRALAREFAAIGVTVNAVLPGLVDTELTADLTAPARRNIISRIPCGRAGLVAEIGNTIAFLCSDDAGYVTGVALPVDGGLSMSG